MANVTISPPLDTAEIGETRQLHATITAADGEVLTDRSVAWRSLAPEVATVSSDGTVQARREGAATISATSEGISGNATLVVTAWPAAQLRLSPALDTLEVGMTLWMSVTVADARGYPVACRVEWSSSDPDVASVTVGKVSMRGVGSAQVVASCQSVSDTATLVAITAEQMFLAIGASPAGNGEVFTVPASGTALANLTQSPAEDGLVDWSADGRSLFFVSNRDGQDASYVMNADGTAVRFLSSVPKFVPSPDGSLMAYVEDNDIWVASSDGSNARRLAPRPANDYDPVWSPDSRQIAFVSERDATQSSFNVEIYVVATDGTGLTNVTNHETVDRSPAWSPDGSRLLFQSSRTGGIDIYTVTRSGTDLRRVTQSDSAEAKASWSPDGTRIAYQSNSTGRWQIHVINADGTGERVLTDNPDFDSFRPQWSPGGGLIAFYTGCDPHGKPEGCPSDEYGVGVIRPDGTGFRRLTPDGFYAHFYSWRRSSRTSSR